MTDYEEYKTITTDVLVIGGGGAGFRAAIAACEKGVRTILISKGGLARSGATPMAGADLTCHGRGMRAAGFFGEPRDSEEKFFNDIIHHGNFLNDQRLTEGYVKDGPDRLLELLEWGIRPNFTDERAVFVSGTGIMDALLRRAKAVGVEMVEDVAIFELLLREGRVCGALGLDLITGDFIVYACKSAIIATGGWHKAFMPVTGSRELTGDGVAMAYNAGAELADMEFITFACNVLLWPPSKQGTILTYVLGMMAGGELENSAGERVFKKYDPWMVSYACRTEWNKSFLSFITAREIRAGKGSPHGGLYFRLGDVPFSVFNSIVQGLYPGWKFKNSDFSLLADKLSSGEGYEVGPGAEYFEGGIAVNERYQSSVPGLYAAGEAASSVFGANRVAAATMEMLTTGARAGWSAGEDAVAGQHDEIDQAQVKKAVEKLLSPLQRTRGEKPAAVRKEFQQKSQTLVGPVRDESGLTQYLAYLEDLKNNVLPSLGCEGKGRAYNKSWMEAIEIRNLALVMEISARAALARTESRGVHYREDFPHTDNENWLKEVVVKKVNDEMTLASRPVAITYMQPEKGVIPYLTWVEKMMRGHSDIGGHH